jgi:hypothetical protein
MKELSLKLVSDVSGLSASQLLGEVQAAASGALSSTHPSASVLLPSTNFQDTSSLTNMSTACSADILSSLFQLPANSFPFSFLVRFFQICFLYIYVQVFVYIHLLQDFGMYSSAPMANVAASMGESALSIAHGSTTFDPAVLNQFFNPFSLMFSPLQPAAEPFTSTLAPAPAPAPAPARSFHQSPHPKFDASDLGPLPVGKNPLLEHDPSFHVHLDMVGITATVHFKCQFNIDALRNYADRNEKKFIPSRFPARLRVCCRCSRFNALICAVIRRKASKTA